MLLGCLLKKSFVYDKISLQIKTITDVRKEILMYILGIDIGRTKCAVITAEAAENNTFLKKYKCDTELNYSGRTDDRTVSYLQMFG